MDKKLLKVIIPAAVWLTHWAVLAAVVGKELILPSPASVARTLLALAGTAAFWREGGLSLRRVNYVELECGPGSAALLREALRAMAEENCQIYQATAPALS